MIFSNDQKLGHACIQFFFVTNESHDKHAEQHVASQGIFQILEIIIALFQLELKR